MKNYNVKGLVGRVSIDTDCFIKALNDKKISFFLSVETTAPDVLY